MNYDKTLAGIYWVLLLSNIVLFMMDVITVGAHVFNLILIFGGYFGIRIHNSIMEKIEKEFED